MTGLSIHLEHNQGRTKRDLPTWRWHDVGFHNEALQGGGGGGGGGGVLPNVDLCH